jgi:hypothetical protein
MTKAIGTRIAATVLLGLGLVVAPAAFAGKGGNGGKPTTGGSPSVRLVVLDPDDGGANYGEQVTFEIYQTATSSPYVRLACYQSGVLVGEAWRGFFPDSLSGQNFYLGGSTQWQSGAADCTASLMMYTKQGWKPLAATSFHVYA